MTGDELLAEFRSDNDDLTPDGSDEDALWKDSDFYRYLDTAQKQFARLTECFLDGETFDNVPVTANDPWVAISPRIVRIHSAYMNTLGRELDVKKFAEMDSFMTVDDYGSSLSFASPGQWRTRTGNPSTLVLNMTKGKGRLAPIPTAADTLTLMVSRLPLTDITDESSTLEVDEVEEQRVLLLSVRAQSYMKQDADTYDSELAKRFEAEFTAACAQIKRNYDQLRHTAGTVRYGGL